MYKRLIRYLIGLLQRQLPEQEQPLLVRGNPYALLAEDLRRAFRPLRIDPNVTHDEIMYSAGQVSVVQFVLDKSKRGVPN